MRRKLGEYWEKRDFSRTPEPRGAEGQGPPTPVRMLRFVIQKHAASHLHYDFRLELDGVMKSWAVPKGPSLDPAVRRLAMEVEDHPIEYNTFEGTIPRGEYGGGTVMLWDRGYYTAGANDREDDAPLLRQAYAAGRLDFVMYGERVQGSFSLIRTRPSDEGRAQWLLMKGRDLAARPGSDLTAEHTTSIDSGRGMEEIAQSKGRVWRSKRAGRDAEPTAAAETEEAEEPDEAAPADEGPAAPAGLEPMLASIGEAAPAGPGWTYEPKYDGIRVLAWVTPREVRLVSRNGKDKTGQFPEIAEALRGLAAQHGRPLVLDGEVVAIRGGTPARFQDLQGRMHTRDAELIAERAGRAPAALFAFDLLLDGDEVLAQQPWSARRRRLEERLAGRTSERLRLGDTSPDGAAMLRRAEELGWEGVIAKRADAPYEPGVRTRSWLKLKLEHRQEFVVGGYTDPRGTREHLGALLLGYFDRGRLLYVGHTGGGFDAASLAEMSARLRRLARKTCPFAERPRTNQPAHWVSPAVVVEVKFSEWTAEGKLRHPIFLGVRDDKDPREVGREPRSVQPAPAEAKPEMRPKTKEKATKGATLVARRASHGRTSAPRRAARRGAEPLLPQLDQIEHGGGDGVLRLPGAELEVSNLDRIFFPQDGYTKGDLMRYYARVAPVLLPALADRPLVLRRFPSGIDGPSFYQQRAADETPPGVRVERVDTEAGLEPRLIGGDLATLLYTVQLGAVSCDPWHSRVGALEHADYAILDLDPGPRAPFSRVVDVARWVRDELDALGLHAVLKTSGATGLHIAVPLDRGTPNESARLLAQLVATRVAEKHPREATVERAVKARSPAAVYVDYLQNILGKTVASVYCVRARRGATVSTPLRWDELGPELDPRDFTIKTVPGRIEREGDLWAAGMRRPSSLRKLFI